MMEDHSPRREIKQGRRAGNVFQPASENASSSQNRPVASPPKPARKQGGWADNEDKRKTKAGRTDEEEEEDERLKSDAMVLLDNENDDIPIIPDLDDIKEGHDGDHFTSAPPSVQVTRVATYKELDNDFEKHAGLFTLDGDIDLKLLGSVLSPEAEVHEEDKIWEWDRIFAEVSSDLRSEWERANADTKPDL